MNRGSPAAKVRPETMAALTAGGSVPPRQFATVIWEQRPVTGEDVRFVRTVARVMAFDIRNVRFLVPPIGNTEHAIRSRTTYFRRMLTITRVSRRFVVCAS